MKKIPLLLLAFFAFLNVNSQILDPVKWTSKVNNTSDKEFTLVIEGTIDNDWHVYSQFTPDGGPLPIELTFKNQQGNYKLVGKASESPTKKRFNDVFGVDEIYFAKKVTLYQKVKIINPKVDYIDALIDYQVCKDVCINGKKDFKFAIPKSIVVASDTPAVIATTSVDTTTTSVNTTATTAVAPTIEKIKTPVAAKPIDDDPNNKELWSIFLIAFLSGFAALLTPCVFPLIPMTVSFFTKQSKTKAQGKKNAVIYGISIIVIYVLLGFLVSRIFGADALNSLATNVWFNLIFFILLIIFAASFLGAFEIMLPHSWANKVDKQADKGGIVGILFMALALAIVSFSCTGPIVGTLLFQAASKGVFGPIIGMFGFSLALALPFMLFAMFPSWLNSLPKSGGWLNTVKVFLGFLELALAFKFLSNADLVLQLHLIEREIFIAIWIAIFGALALYLFGKFTMPHDSPLPHISVGRLFMGLLVLSFTVYLIPGLWGAPLKLINAFPPPMEYSESPFGISSSGDSKPQENLPDGALNGPHGLIVFNDYDKGLAYAKQVHKPILLDFTGYACVNCRKMENNIWSDPSVLAILSKEVVLISLYVDDKRDLPKAEQFISKSTGSKIETIGDKWTDFMISKYQTNTQPLYVLTDLGGSNLNNEKPTASYNPDPKEYEHWLKTGISHFK